MDHARKMILVPADTMHRMTQNNSIQETTMSKLDSEMREVLESKETDSEKWGHYQQILQRYLHFVQASRKPLVMSAQDLDITTDMVRDKSLAGIEQAEEEEGLRVDEITEYLPKTLKNKGSLLLRRINNAGNIKWDKLGNVTINGEKIANSNIIDLIGDVLRQRQKTNPVGWEKFANGLKDINIPREIIGNPSRLRFIHGRSSTPKKPERSSRGLLLENTFPGYAADDDKVIRSPRKLMWQEFKI